MDIFSFVTLASNAVPFEARRLSALESLVLCLLEPKDGKVYVR